MRDEIEVQVVRCVYDKEKKEIVCYLNGESWEKIEENGGIRRVTVKGEKK